MRRVGLLLVDCVLIALAGIIALLLRDNFEFSLDAPGGADAVSASDVGRNSGRFSRFRHQPHDLALRGHEGLPAPACGPSSWPIVAAVALRLRIQPPRRGGARRAGAAGSSDDRFPDRRARADAAAACRTCQARPAGGDAGRSAAAESVLVVGLTRLTELYLRSVAEFAPERVRIAGLLVHSPEHAGRLVNQYRCWERPTRSPNDTRARSARRDRRSHRRHHRLRSPAGSGARRPCSAWSVIRHSPRVHCRALGAARLVRSDRPAAGSVGQREMRLSRFRFRCRARRHGATALLEDQARPRFCRCGGAAGGCWRRSMLFAGVAGGDRRGMAGGVLAAAAGPRWTAVPSLQVADHGRCARCRWACRSRKAARVAHRARASPHCASMSCRSSQYSRRARCRSSVRARCWRPTRRPPMPPACWCGRA